MDGREKLFIEACVENNFKIIQLSIRHGVDIHVEDDWCIEIVGRKGYSNLVKFFLENGISHSSAAKKAVLAHASYNRDIDLVKYLIKFDEYKEDLGAIAWAAGRSYEITELMLGFLDNFDGAFCHAAASGDIKTLNLLIDNGIQNFDKSSKRSSFWAAERSKWSAVELILDNGIGSVENLGENYAKMFELWKKDRI